MNKDIQNYNNGQVPSDKAICDLLAREISSVLTNTENKIWHGHPVWFLEGNPIVGYSKQKDGIRLMFWSGLEFNEKGLKPGTGKFKDASAWYSNISEIGIDDLHRWLKNPLIFSGIIKILLKEKVYLKD